MPNTNPTLTALADAATAPLHRAFAAGQSDALTGLSDALLPLCFCCGTDYAAPVLHNLTSANTQRVAAALRSIVLNGLDAVPTFVPLALSGPDQYDESRAAAVTVAVCQPCLSTLAASLAAIPTGQPCTVCAIPVQTDRYAALPRAIRQFDVQTDDYYSRNVYRTTAVEYGGHILATLAAGRILGDSVYCNSCAARRVECADCHAVILAADALSTDCAGCAEVTYRASAGRTVCQSCYADDGQHSGHASRRAFAARLSLADALAASPDAGQTILSRRLLGCEVETQGDSMPTLAHAFAVEANSRPVWASVGTDGSVEAGFGSSGYEVRGLPLGGADAEAFVTTTRAALAAGGLSANLSTGLHVHVDMRDADSAATYAFAAVLSAAQGILFGASNPDRWAYAGQYGAQYAPAVTHADVLAMVDRARQGSRSVRSIGDDRYAAVNLDSYSEHSTVEVRAFGADTLDRADVLHVMALLAGLADVIVTSQDTRAALLAAVIDAGGRFDAAGCRAVIDAVRAAGYLTDDSAAALAEVARVGAYVLADAQGSTSYSDDDDTYCGACGDYVSVTYADCGCCTVCAGCGHSI